MLVQSNGGKVYAVLAQSGEHELGVMPTMQLASTTVLLVLRCRFKATIEDVFNPMLVPKAVLVGGIERSKNTLRGTVILNTGLTVDKIGPKFGKFCADKVLAHAKEMLTPEHADAQESLALYHHNIRSDFFGDFAKLADAAVETVYPPKDFSAAPALITPFDLHVYMEQAAANPDSPFKVVAENPNPKGGNVHHMGGDHEPIPPAPSDANVSKVNLKGSAPKKPTADEGQPAAVSNPPEPVENNEVDNSDEGGEGYNPTVYSFKGKGTGDDRKAEQPSDEDNPAY